MWHPNLKAPIHFSEYPVYKTLGKELTMSVVSDHDPLILSALAFLLTKHAIKTQQTSVFLVEPSTGAPLPLDLNDPSLLILFSSTFFFDDFFLFLVVQGFKCSNSKISNHFFSGVCLKVS